MASYIYQANVDPLQRFSSLKFQRDDGSPGRVDMGQIYDLTDSEVARLRALIVLVDTSLLPTQPTGTGGGGAGGGYYYSYETPEAHGAVRDGVTDDTAAIQQAIDAAVTKGQQDGSNYGEVWFHSGVYAVKAATTTGARKGNAQITLPLIAPTSEKFTLALRSVPHAAALPLWSQTPVQLGGAVLMSNLAGAWDNTNGPPSIVGGPTAEQGYSNSTFNNMLVVWDGPQLVAPTDPTICGLDLRGTAEAVIKDLACFANATPATYPLPTSGAFTSQMFASALLMPGTGNNDLCIVENLSIEGWYAGLAVGEHTHARDVRCVYCRVGVWFPTNYPHIARIDALSTELCRSHVYCDPIVSGAPPCHLDVDLWDIEDDPGTFATSFHVYDPGNKLRGDLRFGRTDNQGLAFTVNGATGIRLINAMQAPGQVTTPGVPATTVALLNPFYRDAAVHVAGGTVTAITVDGQATGVTAGLVVVPAGRTIALTYSVAPTWKWTLL